MPLPSQPPPPLSVALFVGNTVVGSLWQIATHDKLCVWPTVEITTTMPAEWPTTKVGNAYRANSLKMIVQLRLTQLPLSPVCQLCATL